MFKLTGGLGFIVTIFIGISWLMNIIKLTECDFVAPYKCEAVHGVGIFPYASIVTGWITVEEGISND